MTFCTIAGHAKRQTARVSGPSTIDRSNFDLAGTLSVMRGSSGRTAALPGGNDRRRTGAGGDVDARARPHTRQRGNGPLGSDTLIRRGRIDARIVEAAPTLYQIETRLRAALGDPAPRSEVHAALAPRPRRGWRAGVIPSPTRTAAALVLLYPIDARVHLVLTRRADTLGRHAGQISLPGGAVDEHETIEAAALREAREEVGVEAAPRVVGPLTALHIPVSNFAPAPGPRGHRPAPAVRRRGGGGGPYSRGAARRPPRCRVPAARAVLARNRDDRRALFRGAGRTRLGCDRDGAGRADSPAGGPW